MIPEVRTIEIRYHESICDHHNTFVLYMDVYKTRMIEGMKALRYYISSITTGVMKPDDTMTAFIPYRNKYGVVEGKWSMERFANKKWRQCI